MTIYDKLAKEYYDRIFYYENEQRKVLEPFIKMLDVGSSVIDIGCGVGLDIDIMVKRDFHMIGVDISKEMLKYCIETNPYIPTFNHNFLELKIVSKVSGIIMDAFIHLFKEQEIKKIFKKCKEILDYKGLILITTTLHNKYSQGIMTKQDYKHKCKRFRRKFTEEKLLRLIEKNGFNVVKKYYNTNIYGKKWINVICKVKEDEL